MLYFKRSSARKELINFPETNYSFSLIQLVDLKSVRRSFRGPAKLILSQFSLFSFSAVFNCASFNYMQISNARPSPRTYCCTDLYTYSTLL